MSALLVGYARVSTHDQDLIAQRDALAALGVSAERTYVDHGLTGTNRARPGLREALAACRIELAELFGVGRSTLYRAIKRENQRRQRASRTPTP